MALARLFPGAPRVLPFLERAAGPVVVRRAVSRDARGGLRPAAIEKDDGNEDHGETEPRVGEQQDRERGKENQVRHMEFIGQNQGDDSGRGLSCWKWRL